MKDYWMLSEGYIRVRKGGDARMNLFPGSKIAVYWVWGRLFSRAWYTGNRLKHWPDCKESYNVLFDFGPLTLVWRK